MATEVKQTPFSIKSAKGKLFQELGRPKENFFSDDFVQEKLETIKIKGSTPKNGFWEYKGSSKCELFSKSHKAQYEDELRIFFPANDRFGLWLGSRKKDPQLKFHLDLGNYTIANKDFNFFTNAKFSSDFKKVQFRVGSNYFGKAFENNARIETCDKNFFCLTDRFIGTKNDFVYGFIGTLCLKTFNLCRYDALLGYENKNVSVFLRHITDAPACNSATPCENKAGACKLNLGKLVFNVIKPQGDNTFAGEFEIAGKDLCCAKESGDKKKCCPFKFKVGASRRFNSQLSVKAKIDQNFVFANALKYKVNDKLTVTGSYELAPSLFKKSETKTEDKKLFPIFPLGFQVELNI